MNKIGSLLLNLIYLFMKIVYANQRENMIDMARWLKMINVGTETIETDRLILRRFTLKDADDMLKNWINDKEIQSNYGEPIYESMDSVIELLKCWITSYCNDEYYRWAIVLKEKNENIGQIAFCHINLHHHFADIEYCISRSYQKKGYASEALSAVVDFTFKKTGLNRLQAFHRGRNKASGKVLQKSMMKYEGVLRQSFFYKDKNEYDDKIYYGILKDDYLKNKSQC
ncbi:GNAT family N-acetyltransferase [Bacillus sp. 03113]|uniref:GNAT family N-acetyltransferase n=1 Tax=Bacillus sp. 03113 TaxID=2578211 RepID=UPI001C65A86E|nr:GNAT family protein [Bacillus sp. 03113]